MPYVLKLRDVIVGRSALMDRDRERGIVRGPFRPGIGWQLVEPIFDLLPVDAARSNDEQRARYRAARDTLALSLHRPDGSLVDSARIDIVKDAASSTGLTLEVQVVDASFFAP